MISRLQTELYKVNTYLQFVKFLYSVEGLSIKECIRKYYMNVTNKSRKITINEFQADIKNYDIV